MPLSQYTDEKPWAMSFATRKEAIAYWRANDINCAQLVRWGGRYLINTFEGYIAAKF